MMGYNASEPNGKIAMRKTRFLCLLTLLLAGLQATILPVRACSGQFRETTLREHIDDASLIAIGTVTGSSSENFYEADYTIQVESYLKGEGPDIILATGYGSGGGDCLDRIAIGERWIFFLDGNPKTDDVLTASYLQVYDSIQQAKDTHIAAIVAVTGQNTPASALPFWVKLQYWTYSPVFKILMLVGIPAVVIIGGLIIGSAFRRRKTKRKNG